MNKIKFINNRVEIQLIRKNIKNNGKDYGIGALWGTPPKESLRENPRPEPDNSMSCVRTYLDWKMNKELVHSGGLEPPTR